jgi:predicted dehydrogenase
VTNVAILGCGMISGAYAPTIAEFDHLDLVACADVDPARATDLAERHGVPETCTIDELLAHPDVDLIVNLTPATAHEAVTRSILESGKAAFSEKPLGADLAEAQGLVDLADSTGLRLGCAPDTFLGAGLQTAAAAIEAGAIGTPLAATAFVLGAGPELWHPNPGIFYERGAGPLFDMGPYYVTALVQLLGPAARVAAMARDDGAQRLIHAGPRQGEQFDVDVPTHVAATIELASGVIATLVASFDVAATRHRNIEVHGTEGTLSVPDPNTFDGPVTVRRLGDQEWLPVDLRAATIPQQRGIGLAEMAWATGAGRPHRASGELALHAVDVMAGAVTAAQERRTIDLTSTCTKPPLLAEGLPPKTFDD